MGIMCWKKPYFYILNNIVAKDIDNPEDFEFCEIMYNKYKVRILNQRNKIFFL